jgi:hypothetical protein
MGLLLGQGNLCDLVVIDQLCPADAGRPPTAILVSTILTRHPRIGPISDKALKPLTICPELEVRIHFPPAGSLRRIVIAREDEADPYHLSASWPSMAPWIRFIALRALAQDDELDAFQSLASW